MKVVSIFLNCYYLVFSLVGIRARNRRLVYVIVINFNIYEVFIVVNFKVEEIVNRLKDGFVDVIKKLFVNRFIWFRLVL